MRELIKANNKLIKYGECVDVTRAVVTLVCQNLLHRRLGFFPHATPKLKEFSTYLDLYLRLSIYIYEFITYLFIAINFKIKKKTLFLFAAFDFQQTCFNISTRHI
jgi:hypothetical protein